MNDEASSAAVALQMMNAAIRVWKGNFKVNDMFTWLGALKVFPPILAVFLCTGKVKPCSESWQCYEVEVNDQFCFIKTIMSVAGPGSVGQCFVAKLGRFFRGNWPQQSQCEYVATSGLWMHTPSKAAAMFQGKSQRNL